VSGELEMYKKAFHESDVLNLQWSRKFDTDRIVRIKLEQENAKLKERLKDAESVILTFKKYTDDLIYLTDVEMEIIILNYLEKWGSDE
jgi:hypothetical protein